jgi:hypothetical protein
MTTSTLTLTLTYALPSAPPESGSEWTESRDYPGVRAEVALPMAPGGLLPRLRAEVLCCGKLLCPSWGELGDGVRYLARYFYAPTLAAAEAEARAWHAEGAAVVANVVAAREARLARRTETIRRAHEIYATVRAPE